MNLLRKPGEEPYKRYKGKKEANLLIIKRIGAMTGLRTIYLGTGKGNRTRSYLKRKKKERSRSTYKKGEVPLI